MVVFGGAGFSSSQRIAWRWLRPDRGHLESQAEDHSQGLVEVVSLGLGLGHGSLEQPEEDGMRSWREG
ncbi:hypothetical protein CGLO_14764 [Colletotrichum gloeosporioides Cg-14]|uniref:Uncharacterized protein n=1 Tax=Colletotrichum gloeosporioides (strain Cg-14) TaxID=1237896 RepID=T0L3H0_COLGC|nr:hypothetical protein CGLO_14764 [Colletotrichum gloeosporioides Cg-14]